MAPRITNVTARQYVQRKESFQGNNLFGQWMTMRDQPYGRYVVYIVWRTTSRCSCLGRMVRGMRTSQTELQRDNNQAPYRRYTSP
jgi:hypothetical protein